VLPHVVVFQAADNEIHALLLLCIGFFLELLIELMLLVRSRFYVHASILIDDLDKGFVFLTDTVHQLLILERLSSVVFCLVDVVCVSQEHRGLERVEPLLCEILTFKIEEAMAVPGPCQGLHQNGMRSETAFWVSILFGVEWHDNLTGHLWLERASLW